MMLIDSIKTCVGRSFGRKEGIRKGSVENFAAPGEPHQRRDTMFKTLLKRAGVIVLGASLLMGFGWSPAAYAAIPEMQASPSDINYDTTTFDYAADIAQEKADTVLVPQAADIEISVSDANGATGVMLIPSRAEGNKDYYLNALVGYDALKFTPKDGAAIASVTSSAGRTVNAANGSVSYVPALLNADQPVDEVLTVTMADGTVYTIHTLPEDFPDLQVTGDGVSPDNEGIYTFYTHNFMLRVATDGNIIYYRNMTCDKKSENGTKAQIYSFEPHTTADGMFYSYYMFLKAPLGGKGLGMWVIMDKNYNEIDQVTMAPNNDKHGSHGEGYVDFHEIRVLGAGNYITLSYMPLHVTNLPDSVPSATGNHDAYVMDGIFQQIKDGKAVWEIRTSDYPLIYESSVEGCDYAASSEDNYLDYVHPNAVDYLMDDNGNVTKILVSLRDMSAVYQFDVQTHAIDFILGGMASTLTGYDQYTNDRADDMGNPFKALTFGQHYCRYQNKNAANQIPAGQNPIVSLFDNGTGSRPYSSVAEIPTATRTFCAEIDLKAKTATVSKVVTDVHMHELSPEKYYLSDHCGSVDYFNDSNIAIGWGFCAPTLAATPDKPFTDAGYPGMAITEASHPIITDYDLANDKINLEISAARNTSFPNSSNPYRGYKTADEGRSDVITFTVGQPDYYIAAAQKTMDTTPVINSDDRTLVPVRFVAEALGAQVNWNADDQTVTIIKDGKTVVMTIGQKDYSLDGKAMTMDTAPVINSDNRTMVPVRFVAEALGASVDYTDGVITIA